MKQLILPLSLLLILFLTSCNGRYYAPMYSSSDRQEVITRSLFSSKDRTLEEDDVQRLLNGKILLPDTIRIAVYKFSGQSLNRYYSNWWYDEEYLKVQQVMLDTLVSQMKQSHKVKKVIIMPSIMLSSNPNINELRESAVRLQANMLLVFSLNSDIYYKYKAFKKDEAKAFATCQTILMDIRTGIIPHSSVITREELVKKTDSDFSIDETRKRAETGAALLTLIQSGRGVAAFLDGKE